VRQEGRRHGIASGRPSPDLRSREAGGPAKFGGFCPREGVVSICRVADRLLGVQQEENPTTSEVAMKYVCLIYDAESNSNAMSKDEYGALMGEYMAFTESIMTAGKMVVGEELQPVNTATTLRMRNGKLSTSDGPFAETKEQLGGLYIIDATDLNEALQIAARIPSVRTGSIEVRPVVVYG
jgi:hypothetical protein